MPPVRTVSTAKPVKTERTHEENQERAYIAASRRSDRSLEARIESARRASEIHKKRTGRALRVTEQDVVNEEMYEEEDDDLPAQYRRLTAHLQTNSADFNRKLHAYLATHQAGRQALFDQAIMGGFGHTYPNAPHFAPQMMMHQPPYQQQMLPPQMIHRSPQSFRQAPYPSPQQQNKPLPHQRSQSFAVPQDFHYPQSTGPAASSRADSLTPEQQQQQRRMSMPVQPVRDPSLSPTATRPPNPHGMVASRDGSKDSSRSPPSTYETVQSPYTAASTPQSAHAPFIFNPGFTFNNFEASTANMNYSPFSMALPTETQQMLGPSLDPNDPQTAMFMANSETVPQPFYSYNPNLPTKGRMQHHNQGMNQTLAPSSGPLMDINPQNLSYNNALSYPTASEEMAAAFNPSFGFDATYAEPVKPSSMSRQVSQQGSSGLITPGAEWSNFIDGTLFEEMPASQ
ncbi:uncharacterized protein BKCO1_5000161 [Diplodia corticola]|uniref:Fungal protein n=1 Tax=Diplodia corticola TaxID=236234 RepID=A0A1J9RZB1_9PEZI|nr:uncharacterized protein BKCO1_5000161 [Diplodia corticola]OJD38011.1 fungal protein [Diplodia corticola]